MNRILTMIVPFYRNVLMLETQVQAWREFPDGFRFIVVDDASPEHAFPIIKANASDALLERLSLYRVGVDIPWNRGGARNLGTHVADTQWIIHTDIDHLMPASCARDLLDININPDFWYRFPRYRVGRADATRRKDDIPEGQAFGKIHPHVDSFLCTRKLFWKVGGYDEDYSGCLGGGSPFLRQLEQHAPVSILPQNIHLHVYTRDVVADASDHTLSREKTEYIRRRKQKEAEGRIRAVNPLRFPWERVL